MQACNHEGVPSCQRGPPGNWSACILHSCMRVSLDFGLRDGQRILCPHADAIYQGGGGKDDDYVTRIEFRLLLVGSAASVF